MDRLRDRGCGLASWFPSVQSSRLAPRGITAPNTFIATVRLRAQGGPINDEDPPAHVLRCPGVLQRFSEAGPGNERRPGEAAQGPLGYPLLPARRGEWFPKSRLGGVLLRTRRVSPGVPLRQPHGFEGFGVVQEHLHAGRPPAPSVETVAIFPVNGTPLAWARPARSASNTTRSPRSISSVGFTPTRRRVPRTKSTRTCGNPRGRDRSVRRSRPRRTRAAGSSRSPNGRRARRLQRRGG